MYITVLDFQEGRVYQYSTPYHSKLDEAGVIEDFLLEKGHRLSNCEWMSHADGETISHKFEL